MAYIYANNIPNCDLLKVGHHGSNSSSQKAFINAIDPEYAIIQSGGKYGHPHQVTLDTLNNAGTKVFRNDNNGDIAVSISYADDYIFSAEHIYCTNNDLSKNLIGGDTESAE